VSSHPSCVGRAGVRGGDLNDWTPGVHTLVRRRNGTRSVKVALPEGRTYRFRYLAEGGGWFDGPQVEHHDRQDRLIRS
jgi:hypothetical protein